VNVRRRTLFLHTRDAVVSIALMLQCNIAHFHGTVNRNCCSAASVEKRRRNLPIINLDDGILSRVGGLPHAFRLLVSRSSRKVPLRPSVERGRQAEPAVIEASVDIGGRRLRGSDIAVFA
jgi:hypothetical protein